MANEYEVINIPIERIWNDVEFNCRGTIVLGDVVDLAKDIREHCLQFPIAVQPISDVDKKPPNTDVMYRIVAGHRRFMAFKLNKETTIPAMVKLGLTELQARLLNLSENLKRKELDMQQEALAVERLMVCGLTQMSIAEKLGMSRGWVQVRLNLLKLPVDIQKVAAAGILNQYQIGQIVDLKNPQLQYAAVRAIKNARLSGEKGIDVGKPTKANPFKKKRQSKTHVRQMIEHIGNTIGYGLHTRVLAWANGEINAAELYFDVKRYAAENGLDYKIPISGVE